MLLKDNPTIYIAQHNLYMEYLQMVTYLKRLIAFWQLSNKGPIENDKYIIV